MIKTFRQFIEETEDPQEGTRTKRAQIPLDDEVYRLHQLFADSGYDLFVVGGAVRDYEFHVLSGKKKESYKPKDIDLVTNAPPDIVKEILSNNEAEEMGIRQLDIGAQFGIIVAQVPRHMPDGEMNLINYEIASYRTDSNQGDGRRPDQVTYTSSAAEDAKRRDLTFNSLFYQIPDNPDEPGEIIDYNNGQGLEDIKNKVARPVGDPYQRFQEDQLRVMRLIRFFCRYNPAGPEALEKSDPKTADAIKKFARMTTVSNERIAGEFLSGLKSALSVPNYLKILQHFGIMDRMFPGLILNKQFAHLGDQRNPRLVIAWLLKNNDPRTVAATLNKLKYTGAYGADQAHKLPDHIQFLLELLKFTPEKVHAMSLQRDKLRPNVKNGNVKPEDFDHYVQQHNGELMAWAILNRLDLNTISNFINFERTVTGYDPRLVGIEGPEIRTKMADLERQNFEKMSEKK